MISIKNVFAAVLFTAVLALNFQASAQVTINEVDADTPSFDTLEFVELYNAGGAPVDLTAGGYVLVMVNGSDDLSYAAYDLTGTINAGDYYVIGSALVANVDLTAWVQDGIQNGADAIMLLSGTSAATFPNDTDVNPLPGGVLVDSIIYDTNDGDDAALAAEVGGPSPQINEDENGDKDNHSTQRPGDGGVALDWSTALVAASTPGATNGAAPTIATLLNVYAWNGEIVADFDIDPGAVVAGNFTLTENGATPNVITGVSGTGNTRSLAVTTALNLADTNTTTDSLAVAATANTNAGTIGFYAYPAISLIHDGDIAEFDVISIRATVNGKRTVNGGSDFGKNFSVQQAAATKSGVFVGGDENLVALGDVVEVYGRVDFASSGSPDNCIEIDSIQSFQVIAAGAPVAPLVISASQFLAANTDGAAPAQDLIGVLVTVNGLNNAADNGNGEASFNEGVNTDDNFFDAISSGSIVFGNSYNITGVGYNSFGDYKILPRSPGDVTPFVPTDNPNIVVGLLLDFGSIDKDTSTTQNVVVSNTGASNNLNTTATIIAGGGSFGLIPGTGPIAAGGTGNITVIFDPLGSTGTFNGVLQIESDDPTDTITTVALTGIGFDTSVLPASLIISQVLDGTFSGGLPKALEITNVGGTDADLSLYTYARSGNGAGWGGQNPMDENNSGILAPGASLVIVPSGSLIGSYDQIPGTVGTVVEVSVGVGGFGNGNDAYGIFLATDPVNPIDAFGEEIHSFDANDSFSWVYSDSYAYRNANISGGSTTFNESQWTFAGRDILDPAANNGVLHGVLLGSGVAGTSPQLGFYPGVVVVPPITQSTDVKNPWNLLD